MRRARRRSYLTKPPHPPVPKKQGFLGEVVHLFLYWVLHLVINAF